MLLEGLNKVGIEKFKVLTKFAFDSYHKVESKKVTYIPEGLVNFGFLNKSTEMYAGKGMEQEFSFLHLSLYRSTWRLGTWLIATALSLKYVPSACSHC